MVATNSSRSFWEVFASRRAAIPPLIRREPDVALRSSPLAVCVQASVKTRRLCAVSPLLGRVLMRTARGRAEIWTNIRRETPWLIWLEAGASESLSRLRARVPEGYWIEVRRGDRRWFVAPCWQRRTISRTGRVVPAYSELVAKLRTLGRTSAA